MTIDLPKTAMLGVGSMSGAILDGLLAAGADPSTFSVTTRTEQSAERHRSRNVEAAATETDPDANRHAVERAELVVVGVKPFAVLDVLRAIADSLSHGAVVVSVAVGIHTASMERVLPSHVRVVRALPNTPIGVGHGVTGISGGLSADADAVALASSLFSASGSVVTVPEEKLDAVSAVSGSGPAYVFLLIEEWQRAAQALGFSAEESAAMVQGTVRGAAELLAVSGRTPEDLRRAVTSPKGTTERAIAVLQDAGLEDLLLRASGAAIARAEELASQS